jgi:hypothetical protein
VSIWTPIKKRKAITAQQKNQQKLQNMPVFCAAMKPTGTIMTNGVAGVTNAMWEKQQGHGNRIVSCQSGPELTTHQRNASKHLRESEENHYEASDTVCRSAS